MLKAVVSGLVVFGAAQAQMMPPPMPAQLPAIQPPQSDSAVRTAEEIQRVRMLRQQAALARQRAEAQRIANAEVATPPSLVRPGESAGVPQVAESFRTYGSLNCRGFKSQDVAWRLAFIDGLEEGLSMAFAAVSSEKASDKVDSIAGGWLPLNSTVNEARRGVDTICAAPENGALPVYLALRVFGLQAGGGSWEQAERELAMWRGVIAEVGRNAK